MASAAGAETIDFMKEDIYDRIQELTSGRGADACIDAVGTEPPWPRDAALAPDAEFGPVVKTRSAASRLA
jgi:threonine dehydrogenase-like Zn-dependent dehydrogenase